MENLFALLILASLVLLVIGFFSPKTSLFWDKKNEPTKKRSGMIYGISLVASFILFGVTSDGKKSTNSSANNSTATEKVAENKPAMTQQQLDSIENEKNLIAIKEREDQTIKAPNLTASYDENEVKADENFKGKTFFVEGTVRDIKKDIMDDIYVILEGDQMFRDVQCFFDDKNTASQLQKGMRVTFQGKCDGLMMNVLMKNCVLVDNLSDLKKQKK
jgi:tRNA_anti-like